MCGTVGRLGLHPSTQCVVILIPRGIGLVVAGMPDREGFVSVLIRVHVFEGKRRNFLFFQCVSLAQCSRTKIHTQK